MHDPSDYFLRATSALPLSAYELLIVLVVSGVHGRIDGSASSLPHCVKSDIPSGAGKTPDRRCFGPRLLSKHFRASPAGVGVRHARRGDDHVGKHPRAQCDSVATPSQSKQKGCPGTRPKFARA